MVKVFIGSTKEDLIPFREAVRDAALDLDCLPVMMEYWAAMDATAVQACMDKVDECDIYVGVFAHRYGYCPAGSAISITEMEFDRATANGIPRLCFLVDPKAPWQPDFIESNPGKRKLAKFKKRIDSGLIRAQFRTPADLKDAVKNALHYALQKPPSPLPSAICSNVPPPDRFVGRTDELEALNTAFDDAQAIAITAVRGIGGIGKSTLAKAFARQDTRFPFKLWAELGQVASEDLLPRILRSWIGADFPPDWSAEQMIAETRRLLTACEDQCGKPVLLLLDDVWLETVAVARQLREAAPLGAHVLITTRSEDAAAALDATSTELNILPPDQGAALIIDLIGEQAESLRADFESLSTTLGGHPLALSLAARQLRRNFNPGHARRVIERLKRGVESGEDFKDLHLDTGDTKLDSISATLRLTLEHMSSERQMQFRALGALPLDLPFRAIQAMYACHPENQDEGYKMLEDFATEGMIKPNPAHTEGDWYTQHRLLRAYARALLRQHDELAAAEQRHWDYLTALADEAFDKPPETWHALDDDLPQIHALGSELAARLAGTDDPDQQDVHLRTMSDPPTEDVGARRAVPEDDALLQACENFAVAVYMYILVRYVGAEGRRWLWAGLIAARERDNQTSIRLFTGSLGSWHNQHSDTQTALKYHEQSLALAREQGDKRGEADTFNNIGKQWNEIGDQQKALGFFQQALPLYREIGEKRGEAYSLSNIGGVWLVLGDYQKTLDFSQRALPLHREIGEKRGEATTLNNVGMAWRRLGDNQQALDFYQQALPLMQEVGDIYSEATTRGNIAMIQWDQGQRAEALEYLQIARDLKARIGISTEGEDRVLAYWRGQMGSSK